MCGILATWSLLFSLFSAFGVNILPLNITKNWNEFLLEFLFESYLKAPYNINCINYPFTKDEQWQDYSLLFLSD